MHESMHDIARDSMADYCVFEDQFCGINARTALKLGQTRGALMTAVSRAKIPLVEVTPAEVKKTITARGNASKEEVSASLKALIGFERGNLPYDATDALAIAIAYGLNSSHGSNKKKSSWRNFDVSTLNR
jgi:crossover junction endodeoxyribonuclease RuvC